ncbi:hypothetical protein PEQA60_37370 [Pseudomonas sp. Eqa60]|jgi:hypothetical protein|nr:hypothetical protein [Pseudomonas sp. BIGb0176]BCQ69747.1 hypothetical protein PEQA60_37370 [Pseudomonas sp. Eqa60]VAV69887.1 hypothetical protein PPRCHA0_3585 [Pseudomonas protegens CHA0]
MLSKTPSLHRHTASALRSVAAAWVNGTRAPASFYFGYWFSHWRA